MARRSLLSVLVAIVVASVLAVPSSAQTVHWSAWIQPVGSNGWYDTLGSVNNIHDGDYWTYYGALVHKNAGFYGYGAHVYGQALFDNPVTSQATVKVSMNSPGTGAFEIFSYDGSNWNKIYSTDLQGYKNVTVNLQNSHGIRVHLYYAIGTTQENYDWSQKIYEIDIPALKPSGQIGIVQVAGYAIGLGVVVIAIAYILSRYYRI